jgi:hypothetical protein
MLTEQQTPEQEAAEAAAFEAAFHEERGEKAPVVTDPVEEPPVADDKSKPVADDKPKTVADPEPTPEPTPEQKPVLAGLTEEQIAQVLARVSSQQNTLDKLGGRIGQLMQQVEALKSQPKTPGERRQFDLKLEKLGEAFPELAEMLREDLKDIGAGEAPAGEQPPVFTAEDVNRIVTEKLTSFQQQQERGLEVRMLSTAHPDWEQTIRTPQFALWRDNVIPDGKELMESESAAFISLRLSQFKDWVKQTSVAAPAPAGTPAPKAKVVNPRLANAVLPKGVQQNAPTEQSEEDAFMAGFNAERAKSGY